MKKKVNILQLIGSICLLIGYIIVLLNLIIEIPFELYLCCGLLFGVAIVLFTIVLVKQRRSIKRHNDEQT
ncbi:MAG: hypothetical protein J6R42_01950 [Clostridia bacterium]|nr:hypothetical protein [Clostridia bacterium]